MYMNTCMYVYVYILRCLLWKYICDLSATIEWQTLIGFRIGMGHCPQKKPIMSGSFAETNL